MILLTSPFAQIGPLPGPLPATLSSVSTSFLPLVHTELPESVVKGAIHHVGCTIKLPCFSFS